MEGRKPSEAALFNEALARQPHPLRGAELRAEALVGGVFLAGAIALALLADAERDFEAVPLITLLAGFAISTQVKLDVAGGYAIPSQLVFVPMLLLLPTPWVPLLTAAAFAAGQLPDVLLRRIHPLRVINVLGGSMFALGAALVLVLCGAQDPAWEHWWAYGLALLAQIAFDAASGIGREFLFAGVAPHVQLRLLGYVYVIDVLLTPTALVAAFAGEEHPGSMALLIPTLGLFAVFARDRRRSLTVATRLGEREREAADLNARLLEIERARTRDREEVLAGASGEILGPLGTLTHIVHRIRREEDPAQRAELEEQLLRELQHLRHMIGQFLDYARIKAGRALVVEPRPIDLAPIIADVARAFPPEDAVGVQVSSELPVVLADPGRVTQILFALVSNGVKFSPPGAAVTIEAEADAATVALKVRDRGPGITDRDRDRVFAELRRGSAATGTEGTGLGLYLCRLLADEQHADLSFVTDDGRGTCFTLALPRATGEHRRDTRPRRRLSSGR